MTSHQLEDGDSAPPPKRFKPSVSDADISHSDATPAGRIERSIRSEESVGITEFLSANNVGFKGILKQRYTDFLVNEIDKDGNVLKLKSLHAERRGNASAGDKKKTQSETSVTDVKATVENGSSSVPKQVSEITAQNETQVAPEEIASVPEHTVSIEKTKPIELEDADRALLVSWLGSDTTDGLVKLYNDILTIEREIKPNYKIVTPEVKLTSPSPIDDKDARAQLHRALRRIFFGKIQSTTTDEYFVEIWASTIRGMKVESSGKKKEKGRNPIESWDSLGGEYLHFNLYKENKDTMECLTLLAKFLKTAPKIFAFAGTKDRRAVTVQKVSAHRLKAEKLENLNSKLKGLKVGDFEYKPYPLDLGDLKGNEFTITLRDCEFPPKTDISEVVEGGVSILREKGFINYYGMQRFGTFATSTHEVGKSMLLGDWKKAVHQVMAYDEASLQHAARDEKLRAEACKLWFEDAASVEKSIEALKIMPNKFAAECAILKVFSKPAEKGNYLGSLQKIPRNLRLMFVHAYQSYIWNTIASERLKRYGTGIRAGDLVVMTNQEIAASKPTVDPDEEGAVDEPDEEQFVRARPVTEEEIASGQYTIYDTVIPSPGWDVVYPQNDLKDLYAEVMGRDGLDPFNMIRNQKDLSMTGHYRRLLYKPEKIEWEMKRYEGFLDQLVETDLMYVQRLRQKAKGKPLSKDEGLVQQAVENPSGSRVAIIVKLRLGTSQYATIALRELMNGGVITLSADAARTAQQDQRAAEDVKMENS